MKIPDLRPLPESLQKVAIEELNEIPERVAEDIETLKTWIGQQPHLRARTDEQFLLAFLRGCKFSLEKAKYKIDNYYTLRTKYPEFYTMRDVDDAGVLELIRLGVGCYLPKPLHENGPRIVFVRAGIYPANKFTFADVMRMAYTMQEIIMLEDDYANVNGVIDVLDMSQLSAAHMFQMTPTVMKKMSVYMEDAVPLRQKATHVINTPAGFEPLFNTLKPLMPVKQQARLFVHGNKMNSFYEHIPQEYLPIEYGGNNGSLKQLTEDAEKKFIEFKEYFRESLQFGIDESLRPSKSVDYDNVFGIEGSFRKLNVD